MHKQIPREHWWEPSEDLTFKTNAYRPFMGDTLAMVAKHEKARFDKRVSVLPVQRTGPKPGTWLHPDWWFLVDLEPGNNIPDPEPDVLYEDKARLAIRIDNFYLCGFANKSGVWHALEGSEHLIVNSVPLGFSGSYPGLVKGFPNLRKILLGMGATDWARDILASFDKSTGDIAQLKQALVILVITICEAARFPRIRAEISRGWYTGTFLTEKSVKYVVQWRNFSCAIRIHQTHHMRWGSTKESKILYSEFGVGSVDEALKEIKILLQSRQCSEYVNLIV